MIAETYLDIALVQSSHGDSTIPRQVDMSLFSKCIDLFGLEAGEGEHSDLGFDVLPFSWGLELD